MSFHLLAVIYAVLWRCFLDAAVLDCSQTSENLNHMGLHIIHIQCVLFSSFEHLFTRLLWLNSPSLYIFYRGAWPQLSARSLSCCPMFVRVQQQLLRCECQDTTIIWRFPDSDFLLLLLRNVNRHFHKLQLLRLPVGTTQSECPWDQRFWALKEKPDLIFSREHKKKKRERIEKIVESAFRASDSFPKTKFMRMTASFSCLSSHRGCAGNACSCCTEAVRKVPQKAFNKIIIWAFMWETCNVSVIFVCFSSSAAVFFPPSSCISKNNNKKNLIKNLYISFFHRTSVTGFQGNLYLHLSRDARVHSLEKVQPLRDFEINNSFSITAKCRHYSALATCRVPLIQKETTQRQPWTCTRIYLPAVH